MTLNVGWIYVISCLADRPHIILMNADDLGWNDVGWHNDEVRTPVLDKLVAEGVEIDHLYTAPVCTPSRASLMTGMYPFNTGMQHSVLFPGTPNCVPTDTPMIQELLPQEYRKVYLGKWHLGYCNETCTPEGRGYDKFYGFYNGGLDHYSHNFMGGFDWYRDTKPEWETRGRHTTDLLKHAAIQEIENFDLKTGNKMFMLLSWAAPHGPIQAPEICRDIYSLSIPEPRRTYLGMITCMDSAIGEIIAALQMKNMWDDTVFIFESDNGGEPGGASNYPLAGAKASLWQGGVRIPAFAYSKLFEKSGYKHEGYIHQADWLPTVLSLAQASIPTDLDGVDQSKMLTNGAPSSRNTVPITFDTFYPQLFGEGALIHEDFKLIIGFPGLYSGYSDENGVGLYLTMDNLSKMINGFNADFSSAEGPERTQDCYTDQGQIKDRCLEHYINKRPGEDGAYNFDRKLIMDAVSATQKSGFIQLFNIRKDPREMTNLAVDTAYSAILKEMLEMANDYIKKSRSVAVNPAFQVPVTKSQKNGSWAPGFCDMPPSEHYKRKLNADQKIWDLDQIPTNYLLTTVVVIIVTWLICQRK